MRRIPESPKSLTRRECIARLLVPALAASACSRERPYRVERARGAGSVRRFVPVDADDARVVRSSVGLRPHRSTGFRLEAERLDGKQLIHLYGHGGGGMTLSWGSATMAVDLMQGHASHGAVAVIGAGAIGLCAAALLQRNGYAVTIYAASQTPHTTSNASAATFYPSHVIDPSRVTPEFTGMLEAALRTSYHAYQRLVGPRYGVRWLDSYAIRSSEGRPAEPDVETRVHLQVVRPTSARLNQGEHPFGATTVAFGRDLIIEPAIYLRALMDDFRMAGGTVVIRRFASLREVAALRERVVFNCTGLGARELVGDRELKPASGQLVVLPPQPEVDYTLYHGDFYYMVPRQDGIVLGGTFDLGNESTAPDPTVQAELIRAHARVFDSMR